MTADRRLVLAAVGAVGLVLVLVQFSERIGRELRPEPLRARVAIEVDGSGVARFGRVELAAGTGFTLHAVLEAERHSGEKVYFTEAAALELDGKRLAGESLRPWTGPEKARILWFSVEGPRPVVVLEGNQGLEAFRFQEIYRSDWPRGWSIPGSLQPARDEWTEEVRALRGAPFGTQRFQVRIELFGLESQLVPAASFTSPGAADVITVAEQFATVVATLPDALELPSRVFGLSQLRLGDDPPAPAVAAFNAWFDSGLAFSRLLLLRSMIDRLGTPWEDLEWTAVELADGPPWAVDSAAGSVEGSVAAGDLVRAGERVVVLFEDRGERGVLDYEDLCFDFLDGAEVRRLGEIFSGEGLVEHTASEREGG